VVKELPYFPKVETEDYTANTLFSSMQAPVAPLFQLRIQALGGDLTLGPSTEAYDQMQMGVTAESLFALDFTQPAPFLFNHLTTLEKEGSL